ncbi:PD40 domain-containing protein [Fluviispira vulneris]|uniref:PD40 domain-containing protein n=1 Tax=Fluviispira vulneris TaxID=2763012 RepID=UPI0016447067|nr:PD40 domain-containing protein [Fluviispira vulneris]
MKHKFKKIYLISIIAILNIFPKSFADDSLNSNANQISKNDDSAANLKNNSTDYAKNDETIDELKLDNTIDVGAPGVKKIRMAIPLFALADKSIPINNNELSEYSKRLTSIFNFTNWFEFIPIDSMQSTQNVALQPFQISQWKALKADFVILGKFTKAKNPNRYNLELRLYDIKLQAQLIGKSYSNLSTKSTDLALRRFADVSVAALTGTPGPFMSQIVFVGKKDQNSNGQIFIADFDGGNLKQITEDKAVHISPNWSRDGTKIIYTSFKSGKPDIYIYNLLTKQETRAISGSGNSSGANWSPDGNLIAFSASTMDGSTHIFTTNKFGGNKKPFISTSAIEVEPAFSPNGKSIAYTSTKYGKPMIFVKDLSSGNTTRLTYAGWYNASACWSPDSKTIVFASYDRDINLWDLFKIGSNGSGIERLTLSQGDNEKPSFSPDGRFILFQSDRSSKGTRLGIHKLYYMSKDGSYQKSLNIPIYESKQASWGPRITQFEDE